MIKENDLLPQEKISEEKLNLFKKCFMSDQAMMNLAVATLNTSSKDPEALERVINILHMIAGDKTVEILETGKAVKLGDLVVQQLKIAMAKMEVTKDLWSEE